MSKLTVCEGEPVRSTRTPEPVERAITVPGFAGRVESIRNTFGTGVITPIMFPKSGSAWMGAGPPTDVPSASPHVNCAKVRLRMLIAFGGPPCCTWPNPDGSVMFSCIPRSMAKLAFIMTCARGMTWLCDVYAW
jgi:hypothetical protein